MQIPRRAILRTLPQSFIPIGFKWRHVTAGRNIEPESATQRITLLASTQYFFCLNACGVLYVESPKNTVENVAPHVSQRAIPKIIPSVPFVRVEIRVKFTIRCRSNPLIPMQ